MRNRRRNTLQYTLFGILAGLLLMIVATITQTIYVLDLPFTISNLIFAQVTTPLLWIIDTSPIFIAIMTGLGGFRQDQVTELTNTYQDQLETQTQLSKQLEIAAEELEKRVEERTQAIERRSSYLEAAAEVGRAATSIYDLEELLPQVALFISERFGFYQVGIFILDEQNQYAVMRAASSEGGRRMLARNHKLQVGKEGIVGQVTGTGQTRIALDVGEDARHFDNPELPSTRSEMALPLFYGGRLFGALDVQSTEANAFSEDDISALRVLADQVSMAINNALLFEQLQASIESERRAYGEISRTAWGDIIKGEKDWGYRFFNGEINKVFGPLPKDMIEASINGKVVFDTEGNQPTLSIPIIISDQVTGVVRVKKEHEQETWTNDEVNLLETLTERLSQALESARLFQTIQKQATQEQLMSEISSQVRQSLDLEAVLKTAAKELGEAFDAKEVVIRMNPDDGND